MLFLCSTGIKQLCVCCAPFCAPVCGGVWEFVLFLCSTGTKQLCASCAFFVCSSLCFLSSTLVGGLPGVSLEFRSLCFFLCSSLWWRLGVCAFFVLNWDKTVVRFLCSFLCSSLWWSLGVCAFLVLNWDKTVVRFLCSFLCSSLCFFVQKIHNLKHEKKHEKTQNSTLRPCWQAGSTPARTVCSQATSAGESWLPAWQGETQRTIP